MVVAGFLIILLALLAFAGSSLSSSSISSSNSESSPPVINSSSSFNSYSAAFSPITTSTVAPGPSLKGFVLAITIPKGASQDGGFPSYLPQKVRLYIAINNTVRWTNNDTVPHTVTFTSTPAAVPAIGSGNLAPGATFTYTFTVAGTYQYHCTYHPWMNGTVFLVGELNPYA